MAIRLLPGARGDDVCERLDRLIDRARDAQATKDERYKLYVRWAADAASTLSRVVSSEDLDRLVLTPRHYVIQGLTQGTISAHIAVDLELEQQVAVLQDARDGLRRLLASWQSVEEMTGHVVVPDTNVYLHHEHDFHEVDWAEVVHARGFEPIHLVVPLVVIDELDRAKRRNDVRSRARATLKRLDSLALEPGRPRVLGESTQHSQIDIRVLAEELGHGRLPDPDWELIDVVVGLGSLLGRQVELVTFDTGMVVRARSNSNRVTVHKLEHQS